MSTVTNAKHTAEPWQVSDVSTRDIVDNTRNVVAEVVPVITYNSHATMLANRARIVACVNACAGMDDPAAFIAAVRKWQQDEPTRGHLACATLKRALGS